MINNAKFIKLMPKTAIQDVGFRGPIIKNILNKNDLKGIIYNAEDGSVNILIWGNENTINNSLTQILTEAEHKDILFEHEIKDLSVDISPPSGIFILEDTEKDTVRKFDKGLELLTIGNKHMDDIEKEIRHIKRDIEEALINIKQDKISSEWDCHKVTLTKKGYKGVTIRADMIDLKHIEIVSMTSVSDCVKIYGIKLTLRYNNGQEPSDNAEIIIWKQKTSDPSEPSGQRLTTCKYEDIKKGFTPDKKISLSFQESIALHLQQEYIQRDIQLEDVIFKSEICTNIKKEKDREEPAKKFGLR